MIWDWDVSADKVFTSPETEALLGLKRGALEGPAARWLEVLHPLDRDRFRAALDSVLEQRRGRLLQDFRLRTPDGHYLWFALKARPVVGSDGEVVRLVGTLTDVTEFKNAEERLLHDAVHDNLTGLPNRELFVDRLESVLALAKADPADQADRGGDRPRPLQAGQRLGRHRGRRFDPADAGAPARPAAQAAGHAGAALRRPVRADPAVGEGIRAHHRLRRDAAAGAARADHLQRPRDLPHRLDRASRSPTASRTAPRRCSRTPSSRCITAKRIGGDRIEVFKPSMRARKTDRLTLESELRRALEREEITILYQPIVRLEDRSVAGFEALARWDHPKMGRMSPAEFIAIAEEIGLIVDLGLFVLERTARQLGHWQRTRAPARSGVLPASTCRRGSCCGRT